MMTRALLTMSRASAAFADAVEKCLRCAVAYFVVIMSTHSEVVKLEGHFLRGRDTTSGGCWLTPPHWKSLAYIGAHIKSRGRMHMPKHAHRLRHWIGNSRNL